MQNKTLICFILFILSKLYIISICAQSPYNLDTRANIFIDNALVECIYTYTVNAPLKSDASQKQTLEYITILQSNGSVSKFWDWHLFKRDSIVYTSVNPLSRDSLNKLNWKYNFNIENLFTPIVFKNYQNNKFTVTDEVTFSSYCYIEKYADIEWKLSGDTATVCGYVCHKAVTNYGGKEWTVWYAMDIPTNDGPWKLSGLPGLILKAEDNANTHTFEAITVRNTERPIYIMQDASQIKIDKKHYLREKMYFENLDTDDIIDVDNFDVKPDTKTMLIDGKRLSISRKIKYCPLEK